MFKSMLHLFPEIADFYIDVVHQPVAGLLKLDWKKLNCVLPGFSTGLLKDWHALIQKPDIPDDIEKHRRINIVFYPTLMILNVVNSIYKNSNKLV